MPPKRRNAHQAPREAASPQTADTAYHARVRMYRQGFGDCFLVFLPGESGTPFRIFIDCGVYLGTRDAKEIMQQVMDDILEQTQGEVDLLIATHEHWDHLSGFIQASEAFAKLHVREVWLGWTEDPMDETARELGEERTALTAALRLAQHELGLAGDTRTASEIEGLLGFFGAAGSTRDALEAVRSKTDAPVYKRP